MGGPVAVNVFFGDEALQKLMQADGNTDPVCFVALRWQHAVIG